MPDTRMARKRMCHIGDSVTSQKGIARQMTYNINAQENRSFHFAKLYSIESEFVSFFIVDEIVR